MPSILVGDLQTGLIRFRNLPATVGGASVVLGGAGDISCALRLPLLDVETGSVADFLGTVAPLKSFVAYEHEGKIINAGPIWRDSWDNDSGTLTLSGAGLRSYWDYRFVLPALLDAVPTSLPIGADSNFGPASLRTLAKQMIQQAQTWTGGSVPLVYEADFAGTNIRPYLGVDFQVASDILTRISEVIGGPDIAFRPRFNTAKSHVEWVMQTGDPELKQAGPDHIWDTSVPVPSVKGVRVDRDARSIVTDAYAVGTVPEGEADPLMAKSVDTFLTGLGYPRMERMVNRSSVTKVETLEEHAAAETTRGRFFEETWAAEAHRFAAPRLGDYNEGDYARLTTYGNPRLPDGPNRVRILAYSTTLSDPFVKLSLAPERVM